MADIVCTPKKVRLANTHNVLTRARPLGGDAAVGDTATFDAAGNWIKQAGVGRTWGVIIGITDGKLTGGVGDDAEVLMMGIVAGYDVDPNEVAFDGGDGKLDTVGVQAIGVGMDNGLLYVNPELTTDLDVS